MKIFLIENETDNITAYSIAKDAAAVKGAERFKDQAGLAKLAAKWPTGRLVDIWNSLPGVTRVKKFKDRGTAVARIWKAIQYLGETVAAIHEGQENTPIPAAQAANAAPQTRKVAPKAAPAKYEATRMRKSSQLAKSAKGARDGSKASAILGLLKQGDGATLVDLMEATGWQAHSVRGFLSGTLRKKMGLNVESTKGADGARTYFVIA